MRTSRYPPYIYFASSSRRGIRSSIKLDRNMYMYIYTYFCMFIKKKHIYKKSLPLSNRKSSTNGCQSVIRQCDVSECNTINRQWRRNVSPLLSYAEVVHKSSQYLFYYRYLETTSFDPSSESRLCSRTPISSLRTNVSYMSNSICNIRHANNDN